MSTGWWYAWIEETMVGNPNRSSRLPRPSIGVLTKALEKSWRRETSYDPSNWSNENPAWGQCAVTAAIVQEFLGGILLSGEINGIEHYWNLLPGGRELDLTKRQFREVRSIKSAGRAEREYLLSFPDMRRRYNRLRSIVVAELKTHPTLPVAPLLRPSAEPSHRP